MISQRLQLFTNCAIFSCAVICQISYFRAGRAETQCRDLIRIGLKMMVPCVGPSTTEAHRSSSRC